MKIENQVCTLEQAKKLQTLGVSYKDYQYAFVDFETRDGQEAVLCRPASHIEEHSKEWAWFMVGEHSEKIQAELDEDTVNADGGIYPAYTVAELGVMLPEYVGEWFLEMYKDSSNTENKEWFLVRYCESDGVTNGVKIKCGYNKPTEAESRADMLIYLLENNLTTPEEVNQRLAQ